MELNDHVRVELLELLQAHGAAAQDEAGHGQQRLTEGMISNQRTRVWLVQSCVCGQEGCDGGQRGDSKPKGAHDNRQAVSDHGSRLIGISQPRRSFCSPGLADVALVDVEIGAQVGDRRLRTARRTKMNTRLRWGQRKQALPFRHRAQ